MTAHSERKCFVLGVRGNTPCKFANSLFFWKLHNTVSSSIACSHQRYQKDEKEFYTARYWSSLDSSLALSKALKHLSISADRLFHLYGILKLASRLARVKATLRC
ncbi:hypothetical protein [Microcoleus sp. F4-D5]|uniref:hypothetical protein n=1 Tax=Microcoleus sp. F4-D5 TaxID=2818760 RepID=UPI002FD3BB8D